MVLWTGRLRQVRPQGKGWSLKLETPASMVPVSCPRPVLTLLPDRREGCLAAVKGNLQVSPSGPRLLGRSIILLGEPVQPRFATRAALLTEWVRFHRPDEHPGFAAKVAGAILAESQRNGLDPLLLASLLQIESAYRRDAVSSSGAMGLGQLMPGTAAGLGVDASDAAQNIRGAASMLAHGLAGWPAGVDPRPLALAGYNAGPNLVRGLGAVPDIPETVNYVYFIGRVHARLQQLDPERR